MRKKWKNCHRPELKSAAQKAFIEEVERYTDIRSILREKIYEDKEAKEELTPLNRVKEKLTAIQNELDNTIQKKEVTNDNEETDRSLQRY